MKLLVQQYLRDMKERGELDVILPQLLSELGYEIIHHPRIGGRQAGVDIAAVGPDPDADGKRSLLLFVIKSGDIGRTDWDGTLQAVRPSLGEVIDNYIPHRISPQHRGLPIAVCVCMGGEIQEGIRGEWRGFVKRHTIDSLSFCERIQVPWRGFVKHYFTKKVNFREWNGDRLANLILLGPLKQELLNAEHRSHFQKAVILVSEPEEAYRRFRVFLDAITKGIGADRDGNTRLRQMVICLWIFVRSGLDAGNLDAPYRACELAMLYAWDALQFCPKNKRKIHAERREIFNHVQSLYLNVGKKLIIEKVEPHAKRQYALSFAVQSHSALDVNLALFETLGRTILLGLWHHHLAFVCEDDKQSEHLNIRDRLINIAVSMINTNPTLLAPMRDDHQIEIGMFVLLLLTQNEERRPSLDAYLGQVTERLCYRYVRRSDWVKYYRDYRRLAEHPRNDGDAYFEDSTSGSVLVPFVLAGLEFIGAEEELDMLKNVVRHKLPHMTQQVWVPNEQTDDVIWRSDANVGICIPVSSSTPEESDASLSAEIEDVVSNHAQIQRMEVFQRGLIPLFLTACRHHRIPLPPHLWFFNFTEEEKET